MLVTIGTLTSELTGGNFDGYTICNAVIAVSIAI